MTGEQNNEKINNRDSHEMIFCSLCLFALNSPITRKKYKLWLDKFLNFIGLEGNTIENKRYIFIEKYSTEGSQ